jgi:hypothetical protein
LKTEFFVDAKDQQKKSFLFIKNIGSLITPENV